MVNAVKLHLPAGFYKNGTQYDAAGRWLDGDLVRWHNANIKPIGGWAAKVDPLTELPISPLWGAGVVEAARSAIIVGDTIGGIATYIGTNRAIYSLSTSNAVDNVTPAGFTAKNKDAVVNSGYGAFTYGSKKYGRPRPGGASPVPMVFSWGFASWGTWPIACARGDDGLKVLIKKNTDADFIQITNAPAGVNDVIVTDERFVMTFGTAADGKLIQWSDQEQYNVWTPAIDNQASFLRVAGTGRLVRGIKVLEQILVIGDNDAFSGRFVGPPYVYGFRRVGNGCGIIGPNAVVATDTFAAWIGNKSFWIYDGTVKPLPCDVLDFYFKTADDLQRSKTFAFTISDYSECWWLYQSNQAQYNEPDMYIIYNYAKNVWYTGTLDRAIGLDNTPGYAVTKVDHRGYVYDHEQSGMSRDGRIPYVETGPLEMANGGALTSVSYIYPDDQLDGSVLLDMSVRDMPKDAPRFTRSFDLSAIEPNHAISTHGIMGRDIRMKLYGASSELDWVIGSFRFLPNGGPMR